MFISQVGTMACTSRHSVDEHIKVQATITANLARAAAAIASVAEMNNHIPRQKLHLESDLEDEVNRAVQLALTDKGCTDIYALDFFKAIKGIDKNNEYFFDGVFEASRKANIVCLWARLSGI